MIKFDDVDFTERRPEEVISFFWRSVYNKFVEGLHGVWTKSTRTRVYMQYHMRIWMGGGGGGALN